MRKTIAVAALFTLASCATAETGEAPTRTPAGKRATAGRKARASRAAEAARQPREEEESLYSRLGGKPAIAAVVDAFLDRISRDERINGRFINADVPRLRNLLIEFVCQASGGPCEYTGKDMKTAHAGMRIVDAEFDALVQNLKGALDQFKVPAPEQKDLLGALGPLKPQVVESEAAAEAAATAAGGSGSFGSFGSPGGPEGEPPAVSPPASPAVPVTAGADPVAERAGRMRQVSTLLEKAQAARLQGSQSYAEQLFSAAEVIVGSAALADLAPLFRRGAPPRVMTPLKEVAADLPPQPATVGNSDEDQPERRQVRLRASLSGTVVAAGGRPLPGFSVVTLEPESGKFSRRKPKQRVMEQRNREFAPRVMAIPVGSKVSFPNFDPIYHNVFSRSGAHPFDLGIYKGGHARELVFNKEGVVRVGCNLHANMAAYVAVVAAPHYAVADSAGRFKFRKVTPGRYRLRAWTEASQTAVVQNVEVKRRENSVVVTLSADGPVKMQSDKFGAPRGGTTEE